MSSYIWRQDSQALRVPWQHRTTGQKNSNFQNILIHGFWKFFEKSQKTSYLENYKDLTMRVPWQHPNTGQGISNFWNINQFKFSEKFLKNHKKRHISKTITIWAVILGGKIRNPGEYPDSTQLQGKEFQNFKPNYIKFFVNFFEKTTKNVISRKNYKDLSSHVLEARFATHESTLTAPNYRVGNFKFHKLFWIWVF